MTDEMIGRKIGKLTIISRTERPTGSKPGYYYNCRCECGNIVVKGGRYLRDCEKHGRNVSCGCFVAERAGNIHKTHGLRDTRLASIHRAMCSRCTNPNDNRYYRYGARGIYVCDEWYTPNVKGNPGFLAFYKWAYENGYYDQPEDTLRKDLLSIDRKDVNGPYTPWNCRWITMSDQTLNRRTTQRIYDGEEVLVHAQFEDKYKVYRSFVNGKLQHGWSLNAIIFAAKHPELGMYKLHSHIPEYVNGEYRDKNGFIHLIPIVEQKGA